MDKLQLTVPVTLLDLFQQLGNSDVMQFEASSWTGGLLSVMLQRQDGHVTISVDGIETAVAESVDDRWCCGMKTITSNVLLTTAGVPPDTNPPHVTPPVDTSLPTTSNGDGDVDESVDVDDTLPGHLATASTSDVLQMAACQTIPLVSTLNQTQLQLICSGITDGIDDGGRDPSIVDALNNDTWRSLLDTANISQPVAPPDVETVVTEMETDVKSNPPPEPGPGLVQCNICGNSYQLFGSLYKHVREVHRADPRYPDALKHLQHIRFRRLKRKSTLVLDCWLCDEQCFGHQLFKHISVVHGDREDIDALMDRAKKLYGREARTVYKRIAPGNVRVPCAHCRRSFARKYVKKHEARCRRVDAALAVARLRCDVCGKQFVSRKAIYEHRRRVHHLLAGAKLMRAHKCQVCDREFPAPAKLRCHMITHTGERNYRCEVCGRAFRDAYTMRHHHKTVHLGQYRFHCPKCNRNFDKLRRLNHHRCIPNSCSASNAETGKHAHSTDDGLLSTEGNDKQAGSSVVSQLNSDDAKVVVTCDLCNRVCRDIVALKDHRRVVHHVFITKPTPKFTCDFCHKDYASRAKLNAHLHTHSDERQYVCEVCQRAFKDPYTMKHHHQTQHLHEYRFRCDVCHRPFDKRSHLQRHKCNPAVTKSFCYRSSSPMKTCSASLAPSNQGKEKAIKPPKKRCRKPNVQGAERCGSDRRNIAMGISSDQGDGKTTSKVDKCANKNQTKIDHLGVSLADNVGTMPISVRGETDERHSISSSNDEHVIAEVFSQPTPVEFELGTVELASGHRDTEEVSSTAPQKTTDNIEEMRAGVVAKCVQSASDEQRVVLAYQITPSTRRCGDKRKNQDLCSPVSRGGDAGGQRRTSENKTPGSILVTFLPAAMVKNQQLSHTLKQYDAVTSSATTRNESNNDVLHRRATSDSQDIWENQQPGETGNNLNSPALHSRDEVALTIENGPAEIVPSNGAPNFYKSSCGVDGTAQSTRQRRSLRQEHRRMLKTRQTQIV